MLVLAEDDEGDDVLVAMTFCLVWIVWMGLVLVLGTNEKPRVAVLTETTLQSFVDK